MTPSSDWAEVVAPDEAERFGRYALELQALQQRNAGSGKPWRALHAKGLAGLEADFEVLPGLPEHARVGLFAAPATYRTYVRFSNGSATPQPDRKPDVRGFAMKIVGVPGAVATQDFTMNRGASTPFRDAEEFVRFIRCARRPALLLPMLFINFGLFGAFRVLGRLIKSLKEPVLPLSATTFHSELPIRFGAYAVRYAIMPAAATGADAALDRTQRDHLGEHLAAKLRSEPVQYDFRVQFFRNEQLTPIEDGSVEWPEAEAPFITVARLTLKQQDVRSARGQKVAEFVESLSFNPWNASDEFRPLGNLMRARREVYRLSSKGRGGAAEPTGREAFE